MHSACMITQHIPLVLPKSDTMCAGTKPQNSEYDSIHCSQLCSTYFPGLVLQHIFSCSWALWSSIPHTIPLTFACIIEYEGTHYAHILYTKNTRKAKTHQLLKKSMTERSSAPLQQYRKVHFDFAHRPQNSSHHHQVSHSQNHALATKLPVKKIAHVSLLSLFTDIGTHPCQFRPTEKEKSRMQDFSATASRPPNNSATSEYGGGAGTMSGSP